MIDKNEIDTDFDLPEVKNAPKAKPRIHNAGESTCISCEG